MILTREQAIEKHREEWRWIANECRRQKNMVLKSNYARVFGVEELANYDYICEYTQSLGAKLGNGCQGQCPLKFNDSGASCTHKGAFAQWCATDFGDWERAAYLAELIAELPEKETEA